MNLEYLHILGPVLPFVAEEVLTDRTADAVRSNDQIRGLVWRAVRELHEGVSSLLREHPGYILVNHSVPGKSFQETVDKQRPRYRQDIEIFVA